MPTTPLYIESLGQRTKEIIIEELRYYFQVISQFGTPNSTVKMPIIREAYGVDLRNYPAVFVKILSSRTTSLGINKGFVQDVFSDDQEVYQQYLPGTEHKKKPKTYRPRVIAERYGYLADVTFQMQVWADTTPVRNRMVDEITAAFQRFQKESLLIKGIIVERIDEGEESDFPLNDTTHIFVANITLAVNAELYFDYPVTSITGINEIAKYAPNPNPDQPNYIWQGDSSYMVD
jgi:hypothetical protein